MKDRWDRLSQAPCNVVTARFTALRSNIPLAQDVSRIPGGLGRSDTPSLHIASLLPRTGRNCQVARRLFPKQFAIQIIGADLFGPVCNDFRTQRVLPYIRSDQVVGSSRLTLQISCPVLLSRTIRYDSSSCPSVSTNGFREHRRRCGAVAVPGFLKRPFLRP